MSQKSVINRGIANIYSLTSLQEGMLYHKLANAESTSYVIQNRFEASGEISEDIIKQSLQLLFLKHEVLRTSIVYEKLATPRQVILKNREAEFERIDLSGWSEREQIEQLEAIERLDVERGFDLQQDSLLRIKLVVLGPTCYKMIWTYHHIIMDGWCLPILYGDFKRYYDLLQSGRSMADMERMVAVEKKQTAEYGEYVKWLEQQDLELGLSYWGELLADYDETAEIKPLSKPEPVVEQMAHTRIKLSREQTESLLDLAASSRVTINTVTEAAWGIVLQAYSGTRDVVFGKTVSGRQADVRGIEQIVGLFIATIPTRVRCEEETTVSELLKELQVQGTKGNEYCYCPFPQILGLTKQKADLVKTLYVFENYEFDQAVLTGEEYGLQLKPESAREQTNYGINLIASLEDEVLNLKIMYNPNEFVQGDIESILSRMETVLLSFAANPDGNVSSIETVTAQERVRILEEFNDTALEYPRDRTVVDLFEEQVRTAPDRIAVVDQGEQLTYAELNRKVNQVAWKLREMGVKPDERVAIIAERSIEMVAGIYGIIKAGGAYVPIDPTFPEDRLRFMLEDCGARAVLLYQAEPETELPILDLADGAIWDGLSDNPDKVNKPDDLAYVIYTSGTTGQPKGVMLQHRGVVAMRAYLKELYQVTAQDNVLQFANYVFDAAVWEMTLSLLMGARLTL
ncbi:MAG TPA: condensation domain-containing protein, partial [Bacilli bacterium]|nr:condensation domain-containing protein [Bacilli bacterium]